MQSDKIIYLIPYILSFLTSLAIGVYAFRKRAVAAAMPFSWISFSQTFWTFGYIFELLSPDLRGKIFWDDLQFIGTVLWPFAFLAFAEQFSERRLPLRRFIWPALSVLSIGYLGVVFTDSYHHLIRQQVSLKPGVPFDELTYNFPLLSNLLSLVYAAAVMAGFYLVIRRLLNPHRFYRAQVATVLVGASIPFLGTILAMLNVDDAFHRDISPFTFAISNVIMAFGLFYYRLFEIVPIGREMMFDSTNDMVLVLDGQDRVVDLNLAAVRRVGRQAGDLIGRPAAEAFASWPGLLERYGQIEGRHEFKVGEREWTEVQVRQVMRPGSRIAGRLFVIRDITMQKKAEEVLREAHDELERKVRERAGQLLENNQELMRQIADREQAEKALRESEDRFRRLFELSAEAQLMVDDSARVVDCNQAFLEMFALRDKSEVIGHTPDEFSTPVQPDGTLSSSMGRKIMASVIASGSAQFEWSHLKHDEKRTPIITELLFTLIPISGKPFFHVAIRDITERKRLAEQLQQAQKMEAVGRLAGGVAHDFNNQLMIIMNVVAMLKMATPPSDPQFHLLELGQEAAEKSAALTRQLLAFSRKQVFEPRVLAPNATIANLEKMLTRLIGEDVELVFRPREPLANIKVDPVQIEQVIINLAVNARDAMPDGGKLTIETGEAELDEEYARTHPGVPAGRYVMLGISDNGIGIDADTQARIFEPFFTTKETGKGTGLGLSMVYGIVQQCGGHIFVYSEPGQGTTFKLFFPAVDDRADEVRTSAAPLRGSESILLVEDNEGARETTRMILSQQGFRVITASAATEAIRVFTERGNEIDLLVTDVVMPGMSGRELANRLSAIRPGLRILYVSGYTSNVIAHHGILDPGINYLEKPFTVDALIRKVREVLGQPTRQPPSQ